MLGRIRPGTEVDQTLAHAAEAFAEQIGTVSSNLVLREGVLRAALCALVKALETEFDGYQDVLCHVLREQSALLDQSWDVPPPSGSIN